MFLKVRPCNQEFSDVVKARDACQNSFPGGGADLAVVHPVDYNVSFQYLTSNTEECNN